MLNKLLDYLPKKYLRYHYYRVELFLKRNSDYINRNGIKLIDIGSETSPFRKYFDKVDYYTSDIIQNKDNTIDYVGDISEGINIIDNNSFDYIICTQVLEHLKNPDKAFSEFYRILKSGGKLLLTTHLCFEEHMEPYDFFRFTRYGLRHLGEKNGFKSEHLEPHGGIFQVLSLILTTLPIKTFIKRDGFLYYSYLTVFFIPIIFTNVVCYFLDYLDKEKKMTLNYECIFKKE